MRSRSAVVACTVPNTAHASRRPTARGGRFVRQACSLVLLAFLLIASINSRTNLCGANAATTASTTRNITLSVVQQATTDGITRAITFLSSGYQSQTDFLADVASCVVALTNSTGGVVADPWPRYISLFNIYALYEPSPQLGASRLMSHDDSCAYMSDCQARAVDNNLNCAFGTPNPQLMTCDLRLVQSMATHAPAQDIVVVLVNDAEPSGSGTDGLLYITNMPTFMPYMLVHYLNRAVAGLQEEYDLGIRASEMGWQVFTAENCAAETSDTELGWLYWQSHYAAGLSTGSGSTTATTADDSASSLDLEGTGCSVTEYLSPTQGGCLMQSSSIHHMCPICKEELSLAFYAAGVPNSVLYYPTTSYLDLVAGRCPPVGHTYYVAPAYAIPSSAPVSPHLYLSLGPFAFQSDVEINWTLADGTLLATDTQTLVVENVAWWWTLPTTVTATITDVTPNIRPATRAKRRGDMTRRTTFAVDVWTSTLNCDSANTPVCFASQATFATLPTLPSPVCAPLTTAAATSTPPVVVDLAALDATVRNPQRESTPIIISAAVCGGVAIVLIAVVALVYGCFVRRRPREVLNPTGADTAVYYAVAVMSPLGIALAAATIAIVCAFVPAQYFTGNPTVLTVLAMACVMYVVATLTYCGVLLRWFVSVLLCGIFSFVLGAGFLATGLLSLVFYLDRGSDALMRRMASLWQHMLSSPGGNEYLCNTVQGSLKCSGFHTGCFMTISAECPESCATNSYYVSGCGVPFMQYVAGMHLPVCIVALVCGVWYVLLGTLSMTYFTRFFRLPRNGRLRRAFRNSVKPPFAPITLQEVSEVRRMFALVARSAPTATAQGAAAGATLDGIAAVAFLETVFAERLRESYTQTVCANAPLTFDALMSLHFPHVAVQATPPATADSPPPPQLSNDPAGGTDVASLRLNMDRFAEVAGALSPEELQRLLRAHQQRGRALTEQSLIEEIRHAAAHSRDRPFCRGLSAAELAGLRGAWTALHPRVTGTLSDAELRVFYAWSHADATAPLSASGLEKWRRFLDITNSGSGIGWAEFCYPYARKALDKAAEEFLKQHGCVVGPVVVTRARVADCYGAEMCDDAFLPREREAPMSRVVAHLLSQGSSSPASQAKQKPMSQRAESVVRTLTGVRSAPPL